MDITEKAAVFVLMKQIRPRFLSFVTAAISISLSSCANHSPDDQWKSDQTRYQQQLKRYPDRQSSEQEKADSDAAARSQKLSK